MIHAPHFRAGLLGECLLHSYSPRIHRELADYSYSLFEMPEAEVSAFLSSNRFDALNVTIPYKKTVLPFLSGISEEARRIGSVNTITRTPNGLFGDNTDYFGFSCLLDQSGICVRGRKVLILGSGGASETARTVCTDRGAEITVISRNGRDNYSNLERHRNADVIVNTTPVGMFPGNGKVPLDLTFFPRLSGVIDMIYNPAKTGLLLNAERLGIPFVGGLVMLVAQAKQACELFLGETIDNREIDRIVRKISAETENLILVGMPGCGKTTIGKALAIRMGRRFLDTDDAIAEKTGRTPSEILRSDGIVVFRHLETQCVAEFGKQNGAVIATGGGVPTVAENADLLRQNGKIVFLRRPLKLLAKENRPLSLAKSIEELAAERLPLYESLADFSVDNDATPEEAVSRILKIWEKTR